MASINIYNLGYNGATIQSLLEKVFTNSSNWDTVASNAITFIEQALEITQQSQARANIDAQGNLNMTIYSDNYDRYSLIGTNCTGTSGGSFGFGGGSTLSTAYGINSTGTTIITYSSVLPTTVEINGTYSLALGSHVKTSNSGSMAVGVCCLAKGKRSQALGSWTCASGEYQLVYGHLNYPLGNGYLNVVGYGETDDERSTEDTFVYKLKNVYTLSTRGDIHLRGNLYIGATDDSCIEPVYNSKYIPQSGALRLGQYGFFNNTNLLEVPFIIGGGNNTRQNNIAVINGTGKLILQREVVCNVLDQNGLAGTESKGNWVPKLITPSYLQTCVSNKYSTSVSAFRGDFYFNISTPTVLYILTGVSYYTIYKYDNNNNNTGTSYPPTHNTVSTYWKKITLT